MTTKRDSKRKAKSDQRPKLEKETLKDLEAKQADKVAGGGGKNSNRCRYT